MSHSDGLCHYVEVPEGGQTYFDLLLVMVGKEGHSENFVQCCQKLPRRHQATL